MKINELSSNRRSKGRDGARAPKTAPVLSSPAASTIRWGAQAGATRRLHRCWSGDSQQPRVEAERANSRAGGTRAPIKMLKMKVDPEMCMKTKDQCDNLPDTKDDICAWSHAILHKNTRTLYQPTAHLPSFEPWGTHLPLQNGEAPEAGAGRAPAAADEKPALPCMPFTITCSTALFPTPTSCRERAGRPWPNPRQP